MSSSKIETLLYIAKKLHACPQGIKQEDIENWDSYNGLLLVDELESEFNVSFTVEEVYDVRSIADIKRHLKNHGIKLDD